MNEDNRETMFPSSTYYCGYAIAQMSKNDTVERGRVVRGGESHGEAI